MPQFSVNKLIRDKVAALDRWGGKRTLDDQEFLYELKRKLVEEAEEVMESKDKAELLEELADVQDVIDYLVRTAGFSKNDIKKAQDKKREDRGGFDDQVFAERIVLQEGHRLVAHCRSQPHKYKEI